MKKNGYIIAGLIGLVVVLVGVAVYFFNKDKVDLSEILEKIRRYH